MGPRPQAVAMTSGEDMIHNWILVEPRGNICMAIPAAIPSPNGSPRRFAVGLNGHRPRLYSGNPVWVCVKEHWLEGGRHECLIAFVDHDDSELKPAYEYQLWRKSINIIESKRPLSGPS